MKTPKTLRPKLSPRALQRFDELGSDLDLTDVVTRDRLTDYCQVWDEWLTATEKIAELGAIVRVNNGLAPNPYVDLRDRAARRMEDLAERLGILPGLKLAEAMYDHA